MVRSHMGTPAHTLFDDKRLVANCNFRGERFWDLTKRTGNSPFRLANEINYKTLQLYGCVRQAPWRAQKGNVHHKISPAMPASPIASHYPLNEQWAPLAVYGKRAPLRRKLRGAAQTRNNTMKTNSRKCQTAHARPLLEPAGFS